LVEKELAKQLGKHTHRKKESWLGVDKTGAASGESATGHNAVNMWVEQQILAPGVENRKESDIGTEVFGIASDGEQGLGAGAEQDIVNDLGILQGDGGELFGNGEDDVMVVDGQQFILLPHQPLGTRQRLALGAVAVAAGVIDVALIIALATGFDKTAEGGGTAGFNGAHDAQLLQWQAVFLPVLLAVLSKDRGQFQ
jgi:hypothetical protein